LALGIAAALEKGSITHNSNSEGGQSKKKKKYTIKFTSDKQIPIMSNKFQ